MFRVLFNKFLDAKEVYAGRQLQNPCIILTNMLPKASEKDAAAATAWQWLLCSNMHSPSISAASVLHVNWLGP